MKRAWMVSCTGNFTGLHATPGLRVWCGVRACGDWKSRASVFLCCSPLYFLKQCLSVNLELDFSDRTVN